MSKFLNIWGIDPGKSGGFALWQNDFNCTISEIQIISGKMPLAGKEIDIPRLAEAILESMKVSTIVMLELVHAMPKQGTSSTFTFGEGFGQLKGMLKTLGVPYELVTPQRWKKLVLKDTKRDKAAAIDWVQRTYPEVQLVPPNCRVPHDGIADAVGIMHYGVLTHG